MPEAASVCISMSISTLFDHTYLHYLVVHTFTQQHAPSPDHPHAGQPYRTTPEPPARA